MIKAGIIGCGTIADAHAEQIQRIPGCKIVGVCDKEELMAKQMAERFGIKYYFTDALKLIEIAQPDIVHITRYRKDLGALAGFGADTGIPGAAV